MVTSRWFDPNTKLRCGVTMFDLLTTTHWRYSPGQVQTPSTEGVNSDDSFRNLQQYQTDLGKRYTFTDYSDLCFQCETHGMFNVRKH